MPAPFVGGPAGALHGFRVIELAGPLGEWCGRLLANMGADVIKVEPPGGAATRRWGPFAENGAGRATDTPNLGEASDVLNRSLYFWHTNTSKRGVTLDIERDEGRALLRRLIAGADVFLETLPPGEATAHGLDYGTLAAEHPRLVVCSITPFGQDGPYARLQTTDLVSMALGGPMQSCGYDPDDDLPPVRPGQYHSFHTASHFAATGILAALYEREASGLGQHIDLAAHDCLAVTVEFANTHWYYAGNIVRRQTGRHAAVQPTARTQYRCADGNYVNLALPRAEAPWRALVQELQRRGLGEGLDDPELLDPEKRFAAGSRAYDLLEVLCATHTAEEVWHLGQRLGLTWGAVRAPEDWLDDPHAAARGFFVDVDHPELGRSYRYPGAPFIAHGSPWRIRRRAPLLGEDNDAVFGEFGLSSDERTALRERGII
jgi:crotonobetainyl-CoA:carnitine CoA-transferase CaiB-like acyl-CoA transferase